MTSQECVWEIRYLIIMKTTFQEKVRIHQQICSYALSHENSRSKGSNGQGMGKIGENFGVEPDKSQK